VATVTQRHRKRSNFSITTASTGGGAEGGGVAVTPTLTVRDRTTHLRRLGHPHLTPTYTAARHHGRDLHDHGNIGQRTRGLPGDVHGRRRERLPDHLRAGDAHHRHDDTGHDAAAVPTPTLSFYHAAGSGWPVTRRYGLVGPRDQWQRQGLRHSQGLRRLHGWEGQERARRHRLHGRRQGYWLVAANGTVHTSRRHGYGPTSKLTLAKPIVASPPPRRQGYLLVSANGSVYNYGDAHFYGPTSKLTLAKPIVGIASTPDGKGYWLVSAGGSVYNYGDALFYGPLRS